ncbi:hypothetical protein [Actinomadura violacea]|uniref:Uncharacterized protein n=1 Tax=Actinomadura violacea TaxID=2819934 RepID=A0ABS3RY26_9ACTN|nr:hypothetical protein [Actinomadura violacea]MBO2461669.1 hypothetical protein [Actinomadura violacea]
MSASTAGLPAPDTPPVHEPVRAAVHAPVHEPAHTPACTLAAVADDGAVHAARCTGPAAPPGGHDLTDPANAYRLPGGGLVCIPCTDAGDAAYAARRARRAAARAHGGLPHAHPHTRPAAPSRARTAALTLVQ